MTHPARRWIVRLAAGGAVFALLVLGVELIARFGLPFGILKPGLGQEEIFVVALRGYVERDMKGQIEPSAFRGYRYREGNPGINRWGFAGGDWEPGRREDVLRVACLGASTTAPSALGAYPVELERILRGEGEAVEVMNFGVPGWTSAASLVNYALLVQEFFPDVVLIHHGINDVIPRLWPDFRADYAHYRVPWTQPEPSRLSRFLISNSFAYASLAMRSMPRDFASFTTRPISPAQRVKELLPETGEPFLRNVKSIVTLARGQGAEAVIVTLPHYPAGEVAVGSDPLIRGLDEHNATVRAMAEAEGWPLIDLALDWAARAEEVRPLFLDHVHLKAEGKALKAREIADGMERLGLVP